MRQALFHDIFSECACPVLCWERRNLNTMKFDLEHTMSQWKWYAE